MPEGDGFIYHDFKEQLMLGVHNLAAAGHDVAVTLHTGYTPDLTNHVIWASAGVSSTQYGSGAGYTAGGQIIASPVVTQEATYGKFDGTDVTWTALGPLSPATPSHAILRNDEQTVPAEPLIAYWVLGTTATNGGDYKLQWGATGILNIT